MVTFYARFLLKISTAKHFPSSLVAFLFFSTAKRRSEERKKNNLKRLLFNLASLFSSAKNTASLNQKNENGLIERDGIENRRIKRRKWICVCFCFYLFLVEKVDTHMYMERARETERKRKSKKRCPKHKESYFSIKNLKWMSLCAFVCEKRIRVPRGLTFQCWKRQPREREIDSEGRHWTWKRGFLFSLGRTHSLTRSLVDLTKMNHSIWNIRKFSSIEFVEFSSLFVEVFYLQVIH